MWCTLLSIQRSKYLNKVMLLSGTEHHQMKRWWYTHQWTGCRRRRLTASLKFLSSTLGGNHFEPTRNDIPPNSDASCHVGLGLECLTAKRVWLKWPRAHLWLSACIKYALNYGLFLDYIVCMLPSTLNLRFFCTYGCGWCWSLSQLSWGEGSPGRSPCLMQNYHCFLWSEIDHYSGTIYWLTISVFE